MVGSRKKKSGFRATSESLSFAEQVSRAMGGDIEFDSRATQELVETLHSDYFEEVLKVTGETTERVSFEAGSSRRICAFAKRSEIYFDEQLDMWLSSCTHLTTIAACKSLTGNEYRNLLDLFLNILDEQRDAYLHEKHRENFRPFILNHTDCMELSHAYSRAMTVFVICHELAHILLGHTRDHPKPEHELQADESAARLFLRVAAKGPEAGMIFVHQKLLSAPLLMLRFFDLFERRLFHHHNISLGHENYPPIAKRIEALKKHLSSSFSEGASYVWDGFSNALDDIIRQMPLPPIPLA